MSLKLIGFVILFMFIAAVLLVVCCWQMLERRTFSEVFIGQVVGMQKAKIPRFVQYVFTYKKRGKPYTVNSRLIWGKTKLKTGGLYKIQVFRRRLPKLGSTSWAVPMFWRKIQQSYLP